MGLKNVFKKKEPTEEEIRAHLDKAGISTKSNTNGFGSRQEKFGAFKQYAQERANAKPGFAPANPYANLNNGGGGNPYGGGNQGGGNPYGSSGQGGGGNPYDNQSGNGANPYGNQTQQSNPYGQNTSLRSQNTTMRGQNGTNPYAQSRRDPYTSSGGNEDYSRSRSERNGTKTDPYADPYASRSTRDDVYASRTTRTSTRQREADEESLDLNIIPSNTMFQSKKPIKREVMDNETLDLNELPEEDDLNVTIDEDLPQEHEVNSEDEEVEAIKQDIRFVKQESLALTRNTLRMAQEADASGTNTLGMLGSQSERLYNAEQNINLADTQSKIAEEKVKQIERLNRSIFIPASGNPFNKKSRLRSQEQKIKTAKAQEKYLRDTNRKNMYESEQRIKQGITNNSTSSELYQKYQGEKDLASARRYQFENDSEDDEIEKELANNLDQIALYSKKLKNSAKTMGQEVGSQNDRLRQIEEDADRLDINIHMNNTRLSNIR